MDNDKLLKEIDKAIAIQKANFQRLVARRNELSDSIRLQSLVEDSIRVIESSYDRSKEVYESIDESITKDIFNPIIRLCLRPVYIGKSIEGTGKIKLEFISLALDRVISVDYLPSR